MTKWGLNNMSLAQAKVSAIGAEHGYRLAEAPKSRERRGVSPTVAVSMIALVVLVTAMGHVAQRVRIAALSQEVQVHNRRLAEAERLNVHLRVEIEKARSLDWIEREAKTRLGMGAPTRTAWVVLNTGGDSQRVEPEHEVRRESGLVAAMSGWFARVRSEIGAALSRSGR